MVSGVRGVPNPVERRLLDPWVRQGGNDEKNPPLATRPTTHPAMDPRMKLRSDALPQGSVRPSAPSPQLYAHKETAEPRWTRQRHAHDKLVQALRHVR